MTRENREISILRAELDRLDAEVVELRAVVGELMAELTVLRSSQIGFSEKTPFVSSTSYR
ncbi:MAG: hypothetical protein SFW36_09390 [Leptolyngbyaceae cyanobacterium bins.59]|nr:hypothetical protein [Leptolyngbyaceae cyanobacterium bins.59]